MVVEVDACSRREEVVLGEKKKKERERNDQSQNKQKMASGIGNIRTIAQGRLGVGAHEVI